MLYEAWVRLNLLMSSWHLANLRNLEVSPIGLALPPALPPMSASVDWFGRRLAYVLLYDGSDPLDEAEPVIEIQTCPDDDDTYGPPELKDLLTRARLRDIARARRPLRPMHSIWDQNFHIGQDRFPVTAPGGGFTSAKRTVIVQAGERQATVISHGRYEALRFHHADFIVTALARHGLPSPSAFQPIDDLEPFIAAGKQLHRSIGQALQSER